MAVWVEDHGSKVLKQLFVGLGELQPIHRQFTVLLGDEFEAIGNGLPGAEHGGNFLVQEIMKMLEIPLRHAAVVGIQHDV